MSQSIPSFYASEKELEEELIRRLEKRFSKNRVESQLSVSRMEYTDGGVVRKRIVAAKPDVASFNNESNFLYELKKGEKNQHCLI
ncbi:hypothetical protein [Rossellomorea sp. KS-H15a]|uniref:hypothetical protein n=1 Tax=Rossellomorea sp. KS-H15a TaxID=2963940 RepID=UPI0020C690C1|nr:hypothetical protein [Rossellomorea sp. KS-H15a]UTE77465.1 hypothetical protein M1J35_01210 [Rossellomorea sp. KS-H15a]